MSSPSLVVHRATSQIGGNCIEIASSSGERIVLDMGRPLDAPARATGLLPETLNPNSPTLGVLISHPHQDHYGLLAEAPQHWPVYAGEYAARLIQLTNGIFGKRTDAAYRTWHSDESIEIGPFRVTPYLTDHSAFDAYMLVIDVEGRRILYSGDFRAHGRKASLIQRMMASPPKNVDVLLMEGTNLGSQKPTKSESDLEDDFADLLNSTNGRVFVSWSAQNLDRTVTLYRACLRTRRTLAVDLYTADVLNLLADAGRLPQPGWPAIKVVITKAMSRLYKMRGRSEFVARMAKHGVSAAALAERPANWVVMVRPSLIRDFEAKGVKPSPDDAWSYSQWSGYLKERDGMALKAWFDSGGARPRHIHTSGHASVADLKSFADAIRPRVLVPIHGVAWDEARADFPNIVRLRDGERLAL